MPLPASLPALLLLGPLLAALVVYVVLRWVVRAPTTGTSPSSVSDHALWVGVIGWLASSLQGAMNLGIIPADPMAGGLTRAETIAPALLWPVLGCLTVHALGQLTYPGPRRLRRQAVLSFRRIRDFLPRRLALTTAAIFLIAGAAIARASALPGFAAVAPTTVRDGPNTYSYYSGGGEGRIPGPELAGWLGGALLVLAGGTWLVLWLIAGRRQLECLDAADNAVLRTIAMNRLLRTVATVAAGLGGIAGNFAARPDPALGPQSWTNPAALAGMAVLLVMWRWQPPRLAAAGLGVRNRPEAGNATGRQHPAATLVSSLGVLLGLAAAAPLVAGAFLAQALAAVGGSGSLAGVVALMAALVLLVIAAGEVLLHRNHGRPDAPRPWPRQPVSPALLTTAVLALLAFLVVLAVTAAGQARLGAAPDWVPALLLTAGVGALALPALLLARRRRGIPGAPAGLDTALRAITVHRVVRTLAATLTAQAAALLLTQSNAWAEVLGRAAFGETDPAATSWWPAIAAGAVLGVAATVIAVIPVRSLARPAPAPPLPRKEVSA
ncbi:hypothetical protein [Arthrobacter sp. EPSL27]|uniref:hypothetical protein n=1 Tax=Arthrobacter sp. EPSL27 TaxID=1745378 RepID=UPI0009E8F7BC|nr:hypothetical protein [Arthrobacter sp. EPSL27]